MQYLKELTGNVLTGCTLQGPSSVSSEPKDFLNFNYYV